MENNEQFCWCRQTRSVMCNAALIHSSNGLLLNTNSNLGFGADEAVYNNISVIPFNRKVEFVHIIIYTYIYIYQNCLFMLPCKTRPHSIFQNIKMQSQSSLSMPPCEMQPPALLLGFRQEMESQNCHVEEASWQTFELFPSEFQSPLSESILLYVHRNTMAY